MVFVGQKMCVCFSLDNLHTLLNFLENFNLCPPFLLISGLIFAFLYVWIVFSLSCFCHF